jgi:hypothetical protein
VDAHTLPGLGEPERGRATGDAAPDDRDVDAALMAPLRERWSWVFEPVRVQDSER